MPTVLAQIEAALPQLATSIIVAFLSWMASKIVNWFKLKQQPAVHILPPSPPPPGPPISGAVLPRPATPPQAVGHPTSGINWGQALLHIGVLQLVVNAVGVVVAILVGISVPHSEYQTTFVLVQTLVGTLAVILVFMVIGMWVARANMWRHLLVVALGTVALTLLVNSLFAQQLYILNGYALLFALIQTFAAMGIGGGLAALIRPNASVPPIPVAPPSGLYPQYPGAQSASVSGWPANPGYPPRYPPGIPPSVNPANYAPGYSPNPASGRPTGIGPSPYREGPSAWPPVPAYLPSQSPAPSGSTEQPSAGALPPGWNPPDIGQTPPGPPQQP